MVLFYVGIGAPYLRAREYEKSGPPSVSGNLFLDAWKDAAEKQRNAETSWNEKKERATAKNYVVGVILPILILGTCAFVHASKREKASCTKVRAC